MKIYDIRDKGDHLLLSRNRKPLLLLSATLFAFGLACASALASTNTPRERVDCESAVKAIDDQLIDLGKLKTNMNGEFCTPHWDGRTRESQTRPQDDQRACAATAKTAVEELTKIRERYVIACRNLNNAGNARTQQCQTGGATSCFQGAGDQATQAATEYDRIVREIDTAIDKLDEKKAENARRVEQIASQLAARQNRSVDPVHHTTTPDQARQMAEGIKRDAFTIRNNQGLPSYTNSNPVNDHTLVAAAAKDSQDALRALKSQISSGASRFREMANQNANNRDNNATAPSSSGIPQLPQPPPQQQTPQGAGSGEGIASGISSPKDLASSTRLNDGKSATSPTGRLVEVKNKADTKEKNLYGDIGGSSSRVSRNESGSTRATFGNTKSGRRTASVSSSGSSRMGGSGSGASGGKKDKTNIPRFFEPENSIGNNLGDGVIGGESVGMSSEMASDLEKEFGLDKVAEEAANSEDGANSLPSANDYFHDGAELQAANLGNPDTSLFDRVHKYHKRCQQKGCVVQTIRLWQGF